MEYLTEPNDVPGFRQSPQLCIPKRLRLPLRVAQAPIGVEAAGEEVLEEPRLHPLLLLDDGVGLLDRRVDRVKHVGNAALLGKGYSWHLELIKEPGADPLLTG
jgi:hypothetical protein